MLTYAFLLDFVLFDMQGDLVGPTGKLLSFPPQKKPVEFSADTTFNATI